MFEDKEVKSMQQNFEQMLQILVFESESKSKIKASQILFHVEGFVILFPTFFLSETML